jgi:DNA-binding NtrC family response regulator
MNGLELVKAVRARAAGVCCLVITGFATNETTVEAFRAGARDVLLKPINVEEIQARVLNAAELVQLRREVQDLRAARDARAGARAERPAARSQELTALPSLPGSAAPVDQGRDDILQRLERLGALYRQGLVTAAEFEEKKQSLLARL